MGMNVKNHIPSPEMLILVYPLISLNTIEDVSLKAYMLSAMLGKDYAEEKIREYCIDENVDWDYPPVYYVQCLDDAAAVPANMEYMKCAMEKAGILNFIDIIQHGGHGLGLGTKTDGDGWVERVMRFYLEKVAK